MRRTVVFLAGLGMIVVLVGGAAYLLQRDYTHLASQGIRGSRKSFTANDASKLSDRELLEAVAEGDAPWDVEELRARCKKYSDAQLDAVVEMVVEMAFTMRDPASTMMPLKEEGLWVRQFLEQAREFLPALHAEEAVQRAWQKRTEAEEALNSYVDSQCSAGGSHTPEDAQRLYQICVDLGEPTKYPQIAWGTGCLGSPREWIQSRALHALACCGEPGLAKLRQLGQSGPVLAWALVGTGRPEDIAELVTLCQQTEALEDRLGCLSVLAGLEADRRTAETQETLRSELLPFFDSADPPVRISAAQSAGNSGDTFFLAALEDLAANDPYHETDKRSGSVSGGVHVEQVYERYKVRESAARAVERIRMLDPAHRAMRDEEKERRRRLTGIRSLELNAVSHRRTVINAIYDARPGPEYQDPPPWREQLAGRLAELAEIRDHMLRKMAGLRRKRAQVLGEEDLGWHKTEPELLTAIAAGEKWALEMLGKRCARYPEEWLEEVALLLLDAEEQADAQAAQRLVGAADAIFPDRVRGPMAEYRLARDGDDAAKKLFAARVTAGMTTGRPMITMLHQLYLQIEEPSAPEVAALVQSYKQAVLSHAWRAFFNAPNFLAPYQRAIDAPEDFVLDDLADGQKERLLEYRELKEKVRQIDARLSDVGEPDWIVAAITDQRAEARQRMDVLWRELHRTASAAVTLK